MTVEVSPWRPAGAWWHPNTWKAHCPRGHAYDAANTYRWRRKRYCRACDRRRKYEKYWRHREQPS